MLLFIFVMIFWLLRVFILLFELTSDRGFIYKRINLLTTSYTNKDTSLRLQMKTRLIITSSVIIGY